MAFVSSDQFVKVTSKLRKTGEFSDATLKLKDGSSFKIHKILLGMGSPFFEKLFAINKDMEEYLIHLVTPDAMNQILNWMYCHKMELTHENVQDVLKTAHYLDCFEVTGQCSNYLMKELTAENVLGLWNFAKEYLIKELVDQWEKSTM